MAKLTFTWPAISASLSGSGLATSAKQDTGNASLASIDSKVSTAAKQDTGNSSLSSIDTKTPALGQALAASSVPVVLTAAQVSTLTPLATVAATQSGTWNVTDISGTVSLPTGASTSAKQDTANTSLASIDGKITAVNTGAVVVASSALPAGAATAAKQPALGTAGSASADVITVQGIASMTALKVDGSAITQPISAVGLPLPIGASTSAGQTAAQASLDAINNKTPALGQALAAGSVPIVLTAAQLSTLTPLTSVAATQSGTWTVQPGNTANTTAWLVKTGGKTAINIARNDYTSTSVTTGAYVQLIASTSGAISEVEIFDSSGQTLFLATGGAGSEVNQVYILPGGNGRIPLTIAASTRVSVKAVSATASVGELTINFYG